MVETWVEELQEKVPEISADRFRVLLRGFDFHRSDRMMPSPRLIRDEMDKIAKELLTLSSTLGKRSKTARRLLAIEASSRGFGIDALDRLREDLRTMAGLAEAVRRQAEQKASGGRPLAATTKLIHGLAYALKEREVQATASADGPLIAAFRIALKTSGVSVADELGTVRNALESWQTE